MLRSHHRSVRPLLRRRISSRRRLRRQRVTIAVALTAISGQASAAEAHRERDQGALQLDDLRTAAHASEDVAVELRVTDAILVPEAPIGGADLLTPTAAVGSSGSRPLVFRLPSTWSSSQGSARVDRATSPVFSADQLMGGKALRRALRHGTRDVEVRPGRASSGSLHAAGGGLLTLGSVLIMGAAGGAGVRRDGTRPTFPNAAPRLQTAGDVGLVFGGTAAILGAIVSAWPYLGGIHRARPRPIAGRRWGGLAARWYF